LARKELTANEVMLRNLVKVKVNDIRLRHSLAADREVFETLPGLERDFWRAVQLGKQKEFVVGELTREHFGFEDEAVLALPEVDDEV
jgi:hypothetical protein